MKTYPQAVTSALVAIYKSEGVLCAEAVVERARSSESPLHRYFEWSDSEAAHQYRLEQARHLIRCSVTVLPGAEGPVRAFASLMPDRVRAGGGYRHTVDVMCDSEMRERLLSQALDELHRIRRGYKQLNELAPVFQALDAVERRCIRRQALRAAGA